MPVVAVMKDPERAVETAIDLAGEAETVTAVYVIEVSPALPLDAALPDEEEHARRFLRRAASAGSARGVRVVPRIVRARNSAAGLRAAG